MYIHKASLKGFRGYLVNSLVAISSGSPTKNIARCSATANFFRRYQWVDTFKVDRFPFPLPAPKSLRFIARSRTTATREGYSEPSNLYIFFIFGVLGWMLTIIIDPTTNCSRRRQIFSLFSISNDCTALYSLELKTLVNEWKPSTRICVSQNGERGRSG